MSNFIKKTNRIWDKVFSSSQERLSRQKLAGFHYLPFPVDVGALEFGTIIDGLDSVTVLNAPDEVYPFQMFESCSVPGDTLEWTDKRVSQRGVLVRQHTYTLPHWWANMLHDVEVTEATCRSAVERSPGVKDWLKATSYRRPVYMITGLGLATEDGGPGKRGELGKHVVIEQWKEEEPEMAETIMDDKLFVVKLVKISCDRPSPEGEMSVRIENHKRKRFLLKLDSV